ncbi:hypothetical protein QUF56_11510 [Ureibacillus composti]|nr:hypothetical protein [Ureibacillus composti]
MMNIITERISGLTILCTFLAFVIPFTIYKINEKIHMSTDPPWKQEDRKNQESSSNE